MVLRTAAINVYCKRRSAGMCRSAALRRDLRTCSGPSASVSGCHLLWQTYSDWLEFGKWNPKAGQTCSLRMTLVSAAAVAGAAADAGCEQDRTTWTSGVWARHDSDASFPRTEKPDSLDAAATLRGILRRSAAAAAGTLHNRKSLAERKLGNQHAYASRTWTDMPLPNALSRQGRSCAVHCGTRMSFHATSCHFCLWYTNTTCDDSVHLADRFAKCVPERKLALIHTHTPVSVEYEYPT